MKNTELARIFNELGDLLEFEGENLFKINAYRKASRVLSDLTEDIEVVAREKRLRDIPGIGEAIASKIEEYLATGHIKRYDEAQQAAPPGLLDLLRAPGLGPKTAALLFKHLHISTPAEVEAAARAGKLRDLPGMGEKKEQNILHGLESMAHASQRLLLGEALPLVESIIAQLQANGVKQVVYAGSLRRMRETVGDLDVLAAGTDGAGVIKSFCALPGVTKVLAQGDTKGSIVTAEGRQVDLRVVAPESWGAALQYFTGSKAHNVHLRDMAKRVGLKINEYGVFEGEKRKAGETEESVYAALGLPWIPPELREDRGEIEAAQAGRLPRLLELADLRGDLHTHTNWSDGHGSIEAMAEAARACGHEYMVISDHTKALKVFGGMTEERMREQMQEIRRWNEHGRGLVLLCGAEVDIKADGSMDVSDDLLAELDFVTGSVHSAFHQGATAMTKRLLAAIRNPYVDAIGHPSGRLLGERDPYEADWDAVMREAARTGTVLEVDSQPSRLDLNDQACRRARELGVMLAINSDAHDVAQLDHLRFGVATARRGWVEKDGVINALPLAKFKKARKRARKG